MLNNSRLPFHTHAHNHTLYQNDSAHKAKCKGAHAAWAHQFPLCVHITTATPHSSHLILPRGPSTHSTHDTFSRTPTHTRASTQHAKCTKRVSKQEGHAP